VLRTTEPFLSYHFSRTGIKARTGADEARANCSNIDNHDVGIGSPGVQDSAERVWSESSDSGDCVKQPRRLGIRQTRGGLSGQCFLPMRGGFGYADSSGSLPPHHPSRELLKGPLGGRPILGVRYSRWRTRASSSFASSRSSCRSEAAISTSRTNDRAVPETANPKLMRGSRYLKCEWSAQPNPIES
jgi:hypothetical protein